MIDVITHVSDLALFRDEAKLLAFTTDEDGNKLIKDLHYDESKDELVYGVTKLPVHYSMPESVTVIRADSDSDLQYFGYFHRLGVVENGEYIFDSQEAQETYERVRGDLTQTYTDDDGNELTLTLPYKIGLFF